MTELYPTTRTSVQNSTEKLRTLNYKTYAKIATSNIARIQSKLKEDDFGILSTISSNLLIDQFLIEFIQHDGFERLSSYLLQLDNMRYAEITLTMIKTSISQPKVVTHFLRKSSPIKDLCKCVHKVDAKCKELAFRALVDFITKTKGLGFDIIRRGFVEVADYQSRTPFSEVVDSLKEKELGLTLATLDLIIIMIKNAPNEKTLCNFLARLENLGINDPLQSISMIQNQILQGKLQDLQKGMGIVASSTKYELEIYKNRVKELEKHCKDLESRNERYMEQQSSFSLIKSDMMAYKAYARACQEKAIYYHACNVFI